MVKKRDETTDATPPSGLTEARDVLIRCGMELLTEQGFTATGLDAVLKRATIPKGSFYHYFDSKAHFVIEVMNAYNDYFLNKLDKYLLDGAVPPLQRLANFTIDARRGMERHGFKRGCLVGNLSQEIGILPETYRDELKSVLVQWQTRVEHCLAEARDQNAIDGSADCRAIAEYFWIAWEGAVTRARLVRSGAPLDLFTSQFLAGLP